MVEQKRTRTVAANIGKMENYDKKYIQKKVKAIKKSEKTVKKEVRDERQELQKLNINLTQLTKPYDPFLLRQVVQENDTLNQVIEVYAAQVAGFGLEPVYVGDEQEQEREDKEHPETKQMPMWEAEWDIIQGLADNLNLERPTKEVLQELIRHVEETGNGYLEVIRNIEGNVVGIENLQPEFVTVTQLNDVVDKDGVPFTARYFYLMDINEPIGKMGRWFKTFGDITPINIDGTIADEYGQGTANEVIHIKIGDHIAPYGTPRWIGALAKILGGREADMYNYRFFKNGTASPMALMLNNSQLTEETEQRMLKARSEDQHKIMVIETESVMGGIMQEEKMSSSTKLEKLTDTMKQDGTFLEYTKMISDTVISAFRIPAIFVAKTQDYNRATSETAKQTAEEQVFQPLREMYSWQINRIFKEYEFKYVKLQLKSPQLSNIDDVTKILQIATQAGAISVNNFVPLLAKALNLPLENYTDEQYNEPLINFKVQQNTASPDQAIDFAKAYGKGEENELAGALLTYFRKGKNE